MGNEFRERAGKTVAVAMIKHAKDAQASQKITILS